MVSKACWTPTGDDDENLFPGAWSDGYDDFSPFNVDLHDDDNFTRVNDDVMPESLVIGALDRPQCARTVTSPTTVIHTRHRATAPTGM